MAGRRYVARLTKLQVRNLWADIQITTASFKTHEDWLAAANRELEKYAEVLIGALKIQYLDMKDPEQVITLRLSYEAAAGCKLALIQTAKGAAYRKRCAIREAADGFGEEFGKLVRKAISLEDSKDLQEERELEGVPCEEDEAAPAAPKAEAQKEG